MRITAEVDFEFKNECDTGLLFPSSSSGVYQNKLSRSTWLMESGKVAISFEREAESPAAQSLISVFLSK